MSTYTQENLVTIIENILMKPEALLEALQNENTEIGPVDILAIALGDPALQEEFEKSELMLKKQERQDYAIQQFIGFVNGKTRDNVEMARSMGLTKQEYLNIREDGIFGCFDLKEELDSHFGIEDFSTTEQTN